MSQERFEIIRRYGARLELTPGCESNVKEIYDKAKELQRESGNSIVNLNQFAEIANPMWHYAATGPALQPPSPPDTGRDVLPLPYARDPGPALRTEVSARTPGLVVFSELYYPGFEAEVDGRGAPLLLAWGSLMAVEVPAGEHRVTVRYRPGIWRTGAWTTLAGILGLAVLLAAAGRRDRRRRAAGGGR